MMGIMSVVCRGSKVYGSIVTLFIQSVSLLAEFNYLLSVCFSLSLNS